MSEYPSGVAAAGAYVPELRITAAELEDGWGQYKARGITEKAVPDADEDAVTMGYEAARRALSGASLDGSGVDELLFASTTPPMAEEDVTTRLGAMLAVPEDASRMTVTGSTAAGTQALVRGARSEGRTLVVASDCPQAAPDEALEHAAGAGAAAFVLEPDAPLAVTDAAEASAPYPGTRFREQGSEDLDSLDITPYERRSFEETIQSAAETLEYDPEHVAAAVHAPDGALPYRAVGPLGLDTEAVATATLVDEIGDAGAADVPVALAGAIDDGEDTLLAAGYGSGATATLLSLERVGDGSVATDVTLEGEQYLSFAEYIRRRGDLTSGAPEGGGGYISVPTWQRSLGRRYRLEAGTCPECETVNFPPTGACSSCRTLVEYDPVSLERDGTIEALSVISQGGAPPEFADMQAKYGGAYATGIVSFETPDGDAASAPLFLIGAAPDDIAIGDEVRATIRIIYTQEGVTRYGIKARVVDDGAERTDETD
jgi:hydroxymethylglutaryl-CoA synthase